MARQAGIRDWGAHMAIERSKLHNEPLSAACKGVVSAVAKQAKTFGRRSLTQNAESAKHAKIFLDRRWGRL